MRASQRTGEFEDRCYFHPNAVGHLAIVIRHVPLIPKRGPFVNLGYQTVRIHLHVVSHDLRGNGSAAENFGESSESATIAVQFDGRNASTSVGIAISAQDALE